MPMRTAIAEWRGKLQDGEGKLELGSGAFEGRYSFSSRFEEGLGTKPEELLGAAHAACFSMALAASLARSGYDPKRVHTTAKVNLGRVGEGFQITSIELQAEAEVPDIDESKFNELAEAAKQNCPVSKALTGTHIGLQARLAR
jgi:osmotically inducible protein OsmC